MSEGQVVEDHSIVLGSKGLESINVSDEQGVVEHCKCSLSFACSRLSEKHKDPCNLDGAYPGVFRIFSNSWSCNGDVLPNGLNISDGSNFDTSDFTSFVEGRSFANLFNEGHWSERSSIGEFLESLFLLEVIVGVVGMFAIAFNDVWVAPFVVKKSYVDGIDTIFESKHGMGMIVRAFRTCFLGESISLESSTISIPVLEEFVQVEMMLCIGKMPEWSSKSNCFRIG